MSLYICEICDNLRDSDYREIVEWADGLACRECAVEYISAYDINKQIDDFFGGRDEHRSSTKIR